MELDWRKKLGIRIRGSDKVSSIEPIQEKEKEKAFSRDSRATIRETRTVVLERMARNVMKL